MAQTRECAVFASNVFGVLHIFFTTTNTEISRSRNAKRTRLEARAARRPCSPQQV
jgi:hypothetical protein